MRLHDDVFKDNARYAVYNTVRDVLHKYQVSITGLQQYTQLFNNDRVQ